MRAPFDTRKNRCELLCRRCLPCFTVMAMVVTIFTGCAKGPDSSGEGCRLRSKGGRNAVATYVFTDDRGRSVTIPAQPEHVVALSTADVEILFATGAQGVLAGVPDNCSYPSAVKSIPRIGGMYGRFSPERIVGLRPDLVLLTMSAWDHYGSHLELLEGYGLTVLGFDYPENFSALCSHIRRMGLLFGRAFAAESLATSMEVRRSRVFESVFRIPENGRPRVYIEWISASGRGSTYGNLDRHHELLTTAGGKNLFGDIDKNSFTATDEEVIRRDPQIIIITADSTRFDSADIVRTVASRSGWDRTSAVRDSMIFVLDAHLTWANPRFIEGIESVAAIIEKRAQR